jgi:hypothetical protein
MALLTLLLQNLTSEGGERKREKENFPCFKLPGCNKNLIEAWCQWLVPAILSTQEVDIGRIVVQSQPQQIVQEILS